MITRLKFSTIPPHQQLPQTSPMQKISLTQQTLNSSKHFKNWWVICSTRLTPFYPKVYWKDLKRPSNCHLFSLASDSAINNKQHDEQWKKKSVYIYIYIYNIWMFPSLKNEKENLPCNRKGRNQNQTVLLGVARTQKLNKKQQQK